MPDTVLTTRAGSRSRRAKPRRRKRIRRLIVLFFLFMLMIAGGLAGAVWWKVNEGLNAISDRGQPTDESGDGLYHPDKPLSIVLLGRDTREETGSLNTDVMIVTVVNPQTKQVTMLSLPRDTRVKIPGYRGYHKINAIYANGEYERRAAEAKGRIPEETGVTLTKKTLEQMLGIPIQYYVEVDFDGFKAIIDELGGVEVNVDRRMVYDDPTDGTHIDLYPGLQVLNGEQALGYVRHRHDNRGLKYFSDDFDRNRRQQEVIRAIVDKMTSMGGITKIFSVIDVASQYVRTDLSPEQIKGLAYDFRNITSQQIVTLENGAFWNASLGYTLIPKENRDIIRATLQAEMGVSPSDVAELNDSWVAGAAADETSRSQAKPSGKPKQQTPPPAVDPGEKQNGTPGQQPPQSPPAANPGDPASPDASQPEQPGGSQPPDPAGGTAPPDPADGSVRPVPNDGNTPPPDIPAGPENNTRAGVQAAPRTG